MTMILRQHPAVLWQDRSPPALPLVDPRLTMPDQNLRARFTDTAAPGIRTDRSTRILRAMVLTLPFCVTLALGWVGLGWFALDGQLSLAESVLVAASAFAFYWVALSAASATLGLFWRPLPQAQPLHGLSVAILLPMYGEEAESTIGNAIALLGGLRGKTQHSFSLHVLSDTGAALAVRQEEAVIAAALKAHPDLTIHYRRRPANTDYKSGNIRDWVTSRGHHHDAMLILDADSVMAPESVMLMADRLAIEPGLGLIQTVPRVLPGRTLWQGMQSFATEVYGTNLGRGFSMWAGAEGNFVGHNALLRTRAFAACAGLPHLPGRAPRGGVILSHDFVEAALIRRAGWGVLVLPEADQSFEDTPDTLSGYLRRDRRWCQGNMQHLRLLATPGLHPLSRFHLLQGAMAYLSPVWWLVLLVLWALPGHDGPLNDLFTANPFMPNWPDLPAVTQSAIAALVVLMLIAPKLLGIAAHVRDHGIGLRKASGFALSVMAELLLSAMVAPMLMVHQVRSVLRTLSGFDGGWTPHQGGRTSLGALLWFHAAETLIGLALLALALAGQLSPWLLPIAVCLCLSVPLALLVKTPAALFRPLGTNGPAG